MDHRIVLNDAFKGFTEDQDKILKPEETVKNFKKKLQEINLDILEETKRIDNGRLDIPVYFSVCGKDALNVIGTKKQMGKGATPSQAEASAVMELAERFSIFSFKNNPQNFITDKYNNIKDKAISFDLIAKSVHDNSDDFGITEKIFSDLSLQWTWAYNLTTQKEMLVPFDWFFSINEFNGASAGNCVEESLCQGICEIVERHVSSKISHDKLAIPLIDLDSVSDIMSRHMIEKYHKAGINLYVSDFTLDMGIPTIGILAHDPLTFPQSSELVWTAGTTPDSQKSLSRALSEVAQLGGDFNTGSNYIASGLPKFQEIKQADFIINPNLPENQKTVSIKKLPDLSDKNIKIEIENCISALSKKAMEVISINVMHPKLGVPAFYTMIPGAHFRELAQGSSVGMFSAKYIAENEFPIRAIRKLKEIDKILPNKYYVKFYLGSCFLNMEEYDQSLQYFIQASNLNPTKQDIPAIYSYMGVCLKDMGKYNEALEVLEKGIKIDNQREDIYNLMGFCYFKQQKHQQAIDCFQKVLEINPGSGIDYANIASNYRDMGQTQRAISYYMMAIELDPSLDFAKENLKKLQGKNK